MQIAVCVLCALSQWLSGGTTLWLAWLSSLYWFWCHRHSNWSHRSERSQRRTLPRAIAFMRFQANPGLRFMRFIPMTSGRNHLIQRKNHSLMRIQDGCFRRKLPVALTAVLTALRKGSCNQGFSATHPPFMRFQANPGLRFMRFIPMTSGRNHLIQTQKKAGIH